MYTCRGMLCKKNEEKEVRESGLCVYEGCQVCRSQVWLGIGTKGSQVQGVGFWVPSQPGMEPTLGLELGVLGAQIR